MAQGIRIDDDERAAGLRDTSGPAGSGPPGSRCGDTADAIAPLRHRVDFSVHDPAVFLLQARGVLLPQDETDRLASLRSYDILRSAPEAAYDDLVDWAVRLLDVPMAFLSFVEQDRQWGKAVVGLPSVDLPRELSICSDVVALDAPVVVDDILHHPRYRLIADDLIPLGIRSYLGVPVAGRDGLVLGALCVADSTPRRTTDRDIATLTALAQKAGDLLDLRRNDVRAGMPPPGSIGDRLVASAHNPRELRRALRNDEFTPYFQPIVDLTDNARVLGYEALARWQHPTLGVLTPDHFLPAFEVGDMILSLDAAVLDMALQALTRLRRHPGAADRHVAVNVSGRELARPGLADRVAATLARHGMDPSGLIIEVTETAETDPTIRHRELTQLRHLGVGVLLDDYGSGYANATALLDMPATGMKIDRSIISRIAVDARARELFWGITKAATALGLQVIAEGIEDHESAQVAADCGAHLAQGYFFGRPAPETRHAHGDSVR